MTVKYFIWVYHNQILTCKSDICLPYCQLVSLNLSLNMDSWLHNILIRIRNTLLMPDGQLQRYRCSHSKSIICRNIVLLLLQIIKMKTIVVACCNFTFFFFLPQNVFVYIIICYNVLSWSIELNWKFYSRLTHREVHNTNDTYNKKQNKQTRQFLKA